MADEEIHVALTPADDAEDLYVGIPNAATLTFTLTGATIDVAPGHLAFDVSFAELYTDPAAQALIGISASGWNVQFQSGMFSSWMLTPATTMQWVDGTSLSFAVTALTPDVDPGSYFVGVTTVLRGASSYDSVPIAVAAPNSGPGDLRDTMTFDVDPNVVNGTKTQAQIIDNQLVVTFLNSNPNDPIVPEDVSWDTTPPEFTISFPYASDWPGAFALTTASLAAQFEVSASAPDWSVEIGDGPKWTLRPQSHAILGPAAGVSFTFANVVTQLVKGPTQLFVQWANVPGYRDASDSLPLYKEYLPVSIPQFAINQHDFVVGDEPQYAYLTWSVDNAMLVELSGYGAVEREAFEFRVPIEKSGTFVLTAIDPITAKIETASQSVNVTPSLPEQWIPSGTILMWTGREPIPSGFVLCDGSNGTPDLRDRFILGAGTTAPHDSDSPTHTHQFLSRTFTFTVSDAGLHRHPFPSAWSGCECQGGSNTGIDINGPWDNTSTQDGGEHTHSMPVVALANGTTTVNSPTMCPRWFALLYIMKRYG